ncbi:MAG: metal-dependent hydrolase [Clostridiales bacterium]
MDPVTHAVSGIAISKVAGEQLDISNPVFAAIVVGSIFPDIDILLQKWGDYVYLKNHRGFTHSIVGLVLSSIILSLIIMFIYSTSFLGVFTGVTIGLFSHIIWDLFNSYGAKALWPFYKKKISYSLLVIFDPIILLQLISFIILDGTEQIVIVFSFITYIVFRLFMRLTVVLKMKHLLLGGNAKTFPSITNWFKWQFIVENNDYYLVGERNFITGNIRILKEFKKLNKKQLEQILETNVGSFFKEFTPIFHVESKEINGNTKYTFMDLRYWLKNNFLHHATIEIDKYENIVSSNFCPYSIDRKVNVPENISYQE